MSKWVFAELRVYIEYKAALAVAKMILVAPRNTSKTCPSCNHVSGKNRIRRDVFLCYERVYFEHADIVTGAAPQRTGMSASDIAAPVRSRRPDLRNNVAWSSV